MRPAGGTLAALVLAAACSTGGTESQEKTREAASALATSNFEGGDGNLVQNGADPATDWNTFTPTWAGTPPGSPPPQKGTASAHGWTFLGITDAQATTSDNGMKGGTKQDDNCPVVIPTKAPNKDDLKRVYFATSTQNNHILLALAWERIPQNSTSASAHVAFEFNQGKVLCTNGTSGLVNRTAGDMLILYDFEGGSSAPTIRVERWTTTAGDTCDVGSHSPPCWAPPSTLPAGSFEAAVNSTGSVLDTAAPSPDTLGINEFGEAQIDLTLAGIFPAGQCFGFGLASAVSRSSGNSATAAMEDLSGPQPFNISNCGQIIIRKETSPEDTANPKTSFSFSTTGGLPDNPFSLTDNQSKDFGNQLAAKTYSVTEADPAPNYKLTNIDCSASSVSNGTTFTIPTPISDNRIVTIDLKAGDIADCTFTNTRQLGAIKITKTSSKSPFPGLAGAQFSITGPANRTATSGADGTVCLDGLPFGTTYTVTETAPPNGYQIDPPATQTNISVTTPADCNGNGTPTPVGFSDSPLSKLTCDFTSLAGTNVTTAHIQCTDKDGGTLVDTDFTHFASDVAPLTNFLPGTTCTITIDP